MDVSDFLDNFSPYCLDEDAILDATNGDEGRGENSNCRGATIASNPNVRIFKLYVEFNAGKLF